MNQNAALPSSNPPVPPGATQRHLGDTLWPWFLGAVALGGLAFIVYKVTTKKPSGGTVQPDASVTGDDEDDSDSDEDEGEDSDEMRYGSRYSSGAPRRGIGKFKNALPVRLKPMPTGFKRGTRARKLRGGYTADSGNGYNLEVED